MKTCQRLKIVVESGYGMNEYLYQNRERGPLRTFLCIAAYGMMFTYTMLFLVMASLLAVNVWGNYGWLLRGDLVFAPHWTAPQREAWQQLEHAIRFDNDTFTDIQGLYNDDLVNAVDSGSFAGAMRRDTHTMPHARKADDALRNFVQAPEESTGRLLSEKDSDLQALVFASAEMAQWPAMRFFVEKGFPVNHALDSGYTLLSNVLSNMQSRPTAEVLAQADWLRSKGAEVRAASALWEAVALSDDEVATLEWLLQHGMPIELWQNEGKHLCLPLEVCVTHGVALPVFERLSKEEKLNVNDTRAHATYLQLASENEELKAMQCLLALGAKPDLLPAAPDSDDYKLTPLALLLQSLAAYESTEEAEEALAGVRLLLQHGASPQPLHDNWACPQLHEAVLKLLEEFGHPIP